MCEMLVRIADKINDDPYLDARCEKRGDVITIQEDGWQWGVEELRTVTVVVTFPDGHVKTYIPQWTVIRVPGVPADHALGFLAEETDTDPARPSRVLQVRAFKYDLDASPVAPTTFVELMARKVRKPSLKDPNVL